MVLADMMIEMELGELVMIESMMNKIKSDGTIAYDTKHVNMFLLIS